MDKSIVYLIIMVLNIITATQYYKLKKYKSAMLSSFFTGVMLVLMLKGLLGH